MESLEQVAARSGFQHLLNQLEDVSLAVPGMATDLALDLRQAAAGFDSRAAECLETHRLLVAAWSELSPRACVELMRQALVRAGTVTEHLSRAADAGLTAVGSVQSKVGAAVASARHRLPQLTAGDIATSVVAGAMGALTDFSAIGAVPGVVDATGQQWQPGVIAVQQAILSELQVAVEDAVADWDAAMRTLIAQLDIGFDGFTGGLGNLQVTSGCPSNMPGSVTPAQTDSKLRLNLALDLQSADPAVRAFSQATQQALDLAEVAAGASYLLVYDPYSPDPQGALAIGVGSLESAANVLVMAGGIGTGPDSIPGDIADAAAILAQANALDPARSSAAIVYAGYDAPFGGQITPVGAALVDIPAMLSLRYATAQGQTMSDQLTPILESFSTTTNVTLFLHSFGTTVGAAAVTAGLPADQIIFSGSPGIGYTSADQLPINPAFQFVMANANDPVANQDEMVQSALLAVSPFAALARLPDVLGPNPATSAFGAQVIEQESGLPILQAHETSAYLTREGIGNVASILTQQYDRVRIVGER